MTRSLCFILSTRGNVYGGLETIADRFAAGLAQRGYAVTLLAGAAPGRPRRADWPPGVTPLVLPLLPRTALPLRLAARLAHSSALNLQSLSFYLSFLVHPGARRRLAAAALSVTLLEGDAVCFSRYLERRARPTLYYFSGGIDAAWAYRDRSTLRIAISATIAERSRRQHHYETQGVVTPGIPAELLEGPPAAELAGSPPRLLYAGRLEPNKGVERLLPVVAALATSFPDVTLRLAGDGPARPDLERAAHAHGVRERVVFLGALAPAQVYAELRQAQLFLFPSSYESFGVAALEALAAGAPVVATDLPVLREATGGHAQLLPADDLPAWIAAAHRLLSDPELRRRAAQGGRAWAAQHTWEQSVDRLEAFIVQACGSASAPASATAGGAAGNAAAR
jgi:glycosyltransferase involved in cell wall biosynthesis